MLKLVYPTNGETVSILSSIHKQFLANPTSYIDKDFEQISLKSDVKDLSFPDPTVLTYEPAIDGTVYFSSCSDMSNAKILKGTAGKTEIINLLINTDYYWYVEANGERSDVGHFRTEDLTPRILCIDGIVNARDFGGYKTKNGNRIRQGLIYRTSEPNDHYQITQDGINALVELGVKTDFDIRTSGEVAKIDTNIPEFNYMGPFGIGNYKELFVEEKEKILYRDCFKAICDPSIYPIFVHCWGGVDRTGCFMFTLGALLGVDEETLIADYEFSSFAGSSRTRKSERFQAYLSEYHKYGEDIQDAAYNYLIDIGITDEEILSIKSLLIEDCHNV